MLTSHEKLRIREAANKISIQDSWDELSWEDAWCGKYPEEPTERQIEDEYQLLEKMALNIRKGSDDYMGHTSNELIRVIYLNDILFSR